MTDVPANDITSLESSRAWSSRNWTASSPANREANAAARAGEIEARHRAVYDASQTAFAEVEAAYEDGARERIDAAAEVLSFRSSTRRSFL